LIRLKRTCGTLPRSKLSSESCNFQGVPSRVCKSRRCDLRRTKSRQYANARLRQVDVKAEHYERQVTRAEQERDEWERKHGVGSSWIAMCDPELMFTGSCREVHAIKEGARRCRCSNGKLGESLCVSAGRVALLKPY
jgi:hypothetical protein